jgi:hypothetical protein
MHRRERLFNGGFEHFPHTKYESKNELIEQKCDEKVVRL